MSEQEFSSSVKVVWLGVERPYGKLIDIWGALALLDGEMSIVERDSMSLQTCQRVSLRDRILGL